MILPGKYLKADRCLLTTGGEILRVLREPGSVSDVWARFRDTRPEGVEVAFDWFVLALTLLYSISAVELEDGVLSAGTRP